MNVDKSLGMLLGLVDSVELREQAQAVIGVPFVAPGSHTRHLGVLLSAEDVVGAVAAMFAKRRAGVFMRLHSRWARFDLGYLGRVHVAKQVLANTDQVQLYKERWQALVAGPQVHPRSVRPRVPEDERGCCPLYHVSCIPCIGGRVDADISGQGASL